MKIYKFSAQWCSACKALDERMKTWNQSLVDLIEDVNIEDDPALAQGMRIRSLPTVVVVDKEGIEVTRFISSNMTEQDLTAVI